jgi:hypothetical protein
MNDDSDQERALAAFAELLKDIGAGCRPKNINSAVFDLLVGVGFSEEDAAMAVNATDPGGQLK